VKGAVQERIISRKEKSPLRGEEFPSRLSPTRLSRDPVLYVPGFLRLFTISGVITRRLKNLDFEVYTLRLPGYAAGDIARNARVLLSKMEELRVLLGVRHVSVVGQGLGGVVARYAAEHMGGMEFLGRLIMLGAPNHGSYAFLPWVLFKAARQSLPSSSFMRSLDLEYREMLEEGWNPPYVSIFTPYEIYVVPWSSCRLEGAMNLRVGWPCTHKGLTRCRSLLGVVVKLLEGVDGEERDNAESDEDALLGELNRSLRENPQDEADLFRRGKLLLERGYYSGAIHDLSSLIRLRPDFVEAFMLRAKALRRKLSYGENPLYNRAIRDLDQVIRLRPGWAEAYYERGVCYALLNAWSDAVDNWDRALLLNRDYYPAYLARGLGKMKKGDKEGAKRDFAEVLRIQPDEPEALRFLSQMEKKA